MFARCLVTLALSLALPLAAVSAEPADVAAAVAAPERPESAVALDEVRRPAEVLTWLGLERGDHVLDYFTGSGYYAEIVARAVGPQGAVLGWNPPGAASSEQIQAATAAATSAGSADTAASGKASESARETRHRANMAIPS